MPIARLKTSGIDVRLAVSEALSPERRIALIRERAFEGLRESQEINRAALGRVPPHQTFVDGREDEALARLNPDRGTIVHKFELINDLIAWIDFQLIAHSPIGRTPKSPQYAKSHVWFADGVEFDDVENPPAAETYVVLNTTPYARKIERGLSDQAPDGVYEGVATLASRRFGNLARIRFSYRSFQEGGMVTTAAVSDLRKTMGRREASQVVKRERDTRQPAIVVSLN